MKDLNPIDTFYNGYFFRSRTEARWAVFFDAIGWDYDYEFEAFKLPSGVYLPDFYFPKLNIWAEVKPGELKEIELLKCKELSFKMKSNDAGVDVLLLEGVPDYKSIRTIINGEIGVNVIPLSIKQKNYPFFGSDEFLKNTICLYETIEAVDKSRSARFEFEWRAKK